MALGKARRSPRGALAGEGAGARDSAAASSPRAYRRGRERRARAAHSRPARPEETSSRARRWKERTSFPSRDRRSYSPRWARSIWRSRSIARWRRSIPQNVDLHRHLGNAFFKASRNVEAAEAFEKAVALDPKDACAWGQLGSASLRLQWWDKAIEAFEKARTLEGDKPGGLLALGYAYERKPDFEKALDFYRRAAELSPSWAQPPYRRGRTLIKLDRREDAERELKRALEIDREPRGSALFSRGSLSRESRSRLGDTRARALGLALRRATPRRTSISGRHTCEPGDGTKRRASLARYEQITRETGDAEPN